MGKDEVASFLIAKRSRSGLVGLTLFIIIISFNHKIFYGIG